MNSTIPVSVWGQIAESAFMCLTEQMPLYDWALKGWRGVTGGPLTVSRRCSCKCTAIGHQWEMGGRVLLKPLLPDKVTLHQCHPSSAHRLSLQKEYIAQPQGPSQSYCTKCRAVHREAMLEAIFEATHPHSLIHQQ